MKRGQMEPRGALGLVVVPVVVPRNFHIARNAVHQPSAYVEGKSVLHGGAGNTRGIEIVEQRHVGVRGAEFLDAFVKGIEETFDARDLRWCVRESAEEKQEFMKADELVRIAQFEPRELGEESVDDRRMSGLEAILGAFKLGEKIVRAVGIGRHVRRNSVTQLGG